MEKVLVIRSTSDLDWSIHLAMDYPDEQFHYRIIDGVIGDLVRDIIDWNHIVLPSNLISIPEVQS